MAKDTKVDLDDMVASGGPADVERSPFADDDPAMAPEPEFTIDFSGSEPIREGTYHARVQDMSAGTANSGNPKFVLKYYLPELGRSLEQHLVRTPNAAWKIGEVFRALGFEPDDETGRIANVKRSQVVGRLCMVKVTNRTMERRPDDDPNSPPTVLAGIDKVYAPTTATKLAFETAL